MGGWVGSIREGGQYVLAYLKPANLGGKAGCERGSRELCSPSCSVTLKPLSSLHGRDGEFNVEGSCVIKRGCFVDT